MRKIVEDQRLIYKCCKLYHEEGLNQQQIADQLMISRVSVCRMLKIGREQGMVIVRVLSPDRLQYSRLEQKLGVFQKAIKIVDTEEKAKKAQKTPGENYMENPGIYF